VLKKKLCDKESVSARVLAHGMMKRLSTNPITNVNSGTRSKKSYHFADILGDHSPMKLSEALAVSFVDLRC